MSMTDVAARRREFERQNEARYTEASGLINLLCNEIEVSQRFLSHLASEALGSVCGVTALSGSPPGRCTGDAVAIRWEDGFADDVCEQHAQMARERGALVIEPHRHDGELRSAQKDST